MSGHSSFDNDIADGCAGAGRNLQIISPDSVMADLADTIRLVCKVRGKMTIGALAQRAGIAQRRLEKLIHNFVGGGCNEVGRHFKYITIMGDSIMRGFYQGFIAAMSGDCLHGGLCQELSITGSQLGEDTPIFDWEEYQRQMDGNAAVPAMCKPGFNQILCHSYLRKQVKLCSGALTVRFIWAPGEAAGEALVSAEKLLLKLLEDKSAKSLIVAGGGLHGSYGNAATFFGGFKRLFDLIPDDSRTMFAWVSCDARTNTVDIRYRVDQSNYKLHRFDTNMTDLLNKYFDGRTNTHWFNFKPFNLTANLGGFVDRSEGEDHPVYQPGCSTLSPPDGTHNDFCVNAIKAKIFMNSMCDMLGPELCPSGTTKQISLGMRPGECLNMSKLSHHDTQLMP